MAGTVTNYRFLLRGGTAAALAARNEVPLDRELIVEKDARRFKLGDGETPYNGLPYVGETPRYSYLTASFDGGGAPIEVGTFCDTFVPFGFKPLRATLLADTLGVLEVDAQAAPYANFPPTSAHSIFGGTLPALSGADHWQGGPAGGWAPVGAGRAVRFVVTDCADITRATLIIEAERQWQG